MSYIPRMLIGLAFLVPGFGWSQVAEGGKVISTDPQLKWIRSLRPTVDISSRSTSVSPLYQSPGSPSDGSGLLVPAAKASDGSTLAAKDQEPQKWGILLADKTLYRTMRRWSQEAQYQLLWQVDRDYPIEAEVVFESTLRQAVAQVMAGIALTDYPLQAVFNPSTRVLRVVRHLDEGRR